MSRKRARDPPDARSDDDFDPREHQGCYVFAASTTADASAARPSKRRKTSDTIARPSAAPSERSMFPTFLSGAEKPDTARLRWEAYHRLWAAQEARLNAILDSFNRKTLDDVSEFVGHATPKRYGGKVPTGLVLAGPNIASHGSLFTQLAARIRDRDCAGPVVVLTSKDAANLKGALKKLIRDATQQDEGVDDEEEERILGKKGAKFLNYDLRILRNWCALNEGQKVTVAIQDTEAFDTGILVDLISLISAYLDRIPFVLLLGIATSIEIFHEKIPKATIRMMSGEKFDVERAEECLVQIFNDAVISDKSVLKLGAPVCDFLLDRYRNHTQSIQAFVAGLKFAYMAHFYANPLSIILAYVDDPDALNDVLTDAHIEALCTLPSYRHFVEAKLADRDTTEVRALLDDKEYITELICTAVGECRAHIVSLGQALKLLEVMRGCLQTSTPVPRYELYAKFVSGELSATSPMVRDLLLSIRKMNSKALLSLLETVIADDSLSEPASRFAPLHEEIADLVKEAVATEGKATLNSGEYDPMSSTAEALRSTLVSKKIQLSDHARSLTKSDNAYTKLAQEVHDRVQHYFSKTLVPLENILLHEPFFYDSLSPHRDVFAARSRATIERALTHPTDYLACDCCKADDTDSGEEDGDDDLLKGSMPSTAIVYKLYLETGTLINAYDLWSAYWSVVGEDDDHNIDKETAQAMFYRSVAEMRWLGMVKGTRKRVDHLQKVAWKGL